MRLSYNFSLIDATHQIKKLKKNTWFHSLKLCIEELLSTQFAVNDFQIRVSIIDSLDEEDFPNLPVLLTVNYHHYLDKTENKSYSIVIQDLVDKLNKPIFIKNPILRVESIGANMANCIVLIETSE